MSGFQGKKEALESQQELACQASYELERERKLVKEKAKELKGVEAVGEFLRCVAHGEQDKAEGMLREEPSLALKKGTVTDLSKREFKGITGFQYALWALDWHMWRMLLKYMGKEAAALQFVELEENGTMHGKHFSLQPLISALQMYVDNAERVWNYDQRATDHWCKVVGETQKGLVAHIVNEYCRSDRPFDPCPLEWESKLPRTREMDVWDSMQLKYIKGSWFTAPSSKDELGRNFAFYRYKYGCVVNSTGEAAYCRGEVAVDYKALQSLWKTRTQQLEQLTYHVKQGLILHEVLITVGLFKPIIHLVHDYTEEIGETNVNNPNVYR